MGQHTELLTASSLKRRFHLISRHSDFTLLCIDELTVMLLLKKSLVKGKDHSKALYFENQLLLIMKKNFPLQSLLRFLYSLVGTFYASLKAKPALFELEKSAVLCFVCQMDLSFRKTSDQLMLYLSA